MKIVRLVGLLVGVIAAFVAAALFLPHSPSGLRDVLDGFGAAAPVIALAAWVLLTPALFPGTVLAAACGVAFGGVVGGAIAVVGAVLGGLLAFGLARSGMRTTVERLLRRRQSLRRVEAALESHGFQAALAARLMPGVPATWLHYVAGMSPVRVRSFAAAMTVGAVLRTLPYALLGESLSTGSSSSFLLALGSIVIGGVAAAALGRKLRAATRAASAPAAP